MINPLNWWKKKDKITLLFEKIQKLGNFKLRIGDDTITIVNKKDNLMIASCRIQPFPSCPAMCIFRNVKVHEEYRGKGIGTLYHQIRLQHARNLGYSVAFATIDLKNEPQFKIMQKFDWVVVNSIKNEKTGNIIYTYQKLLIND